MKQTYCVYQHVRLDTNEVFYIGIGSLKRSASKRDRNQFWHHIVDKVGYEVQVLFENVSIEFAIQKEIELIKAFGRRDLKLGTLVNLTNGGEGAFGRVVSSENIRKLSKAGTEARKLKRDQELKTRKESLKARRRKHILCPMTEEKTLLKGKKIKNAWAKMDLNLKASISQRAALRQTKGEIIAFKSETKEFIGRYDNTVVAAKELNIANNIGRVLNGKVSSYKGFYFERVSST